VGTLRFDLNTLAGTKAKDAKNDALAARKEFIRAVSGLLLAWTRTSSCEKYSYARDFRLQLACLVLLLHVCFCRYLWVGALHRVQSLDASSAITKMPPRSRLASHCRLQLACLILLLHVCFCRYLWVGALHRVQSLDASSAITKMPPRSHLASHCRLQLACLVLLLHVCFCRYLWVGALHRVQSLDASSAITKMPPRSHLASHCRLVAVPCCVPCSG
jgi:cytochrome c-type biogenesis protein CcmH/NrfG